MQHHLRHPRLRPQPGRLNVQTPMMELTGHLAKCVMQTLWRGLCSLENGLSIPMHCIHTRAGKRAALKTHTAAHRADRLRRGQPGKFRRTFSRLTARIARRCCR